MKFTLRQKKPKHNFMCDTSKARMASMASARAAWIVNNISSKNAGILEELNQICSS